jgi:hypothetical protein
MQDDQQRITAIKKKSREIMASLGSVVAFVNFSEGIMPSVKTLLQSKLDKTLTDLIELMRLLDDKTYERLKRAQEDSEKEE